MGHTFAKKQGKKVKQIFYASPEVVRYLNAERKMSSMSKSSIINVHITESKAFKNWTSLFNKEPHAKESSR